MNIKPMNLDGSSTRKKMSLEEFYNFAASADGRWEFISGVPVALVSPSDKHQAIVAEMSGVLWQYLKDKKCQYRPGMDVKLFDDSNDIVIPDLLVFCNEDQNDGKRINGALALVVEIWSPSNKSAERYRKLTMYIEAGVGEIWEIYPEKNFARRHTAIGDGEYSEVSIPFWNIATSEYFSGLYFDLSKFL